MKRKALGRGLSALIPAAVEQKPGAAPATGSKDYFICPIEHLRPNKNQPRKLFEDDKLAELAASVREQGVLQPLLVRPVKGGKYEIVAGERRWRAAQKAGLHELPVVIKDLSDQESFEIALVENLQRADLNPMEEAEGYQRLITEHKYTQEQLALRLGKDRTTITNTLRLLKLPSTAQKAVRGGTLSPGHARALLGLEKASLIEQAASQVKAKQLSVRQTESLVRSLRKSDASPAAAPPPMSANLRDLQERIGRALKTQVRLVVTDTERGRIEITYGSFDELDRLLEVLLR